MISKITYTPSAFSMQNYNCCGPKKGMAVPFNGALKADTVEIAANKMKTVEEVIKSAFKKLAKNKGEYMSTSGDVNIYLQETKLGKEAQLTLSNGIFEGKSYVNFLLKKSINEKPHVEPLDTDLSIQEANKYVQTYLNDLK